MPGRHVGGDVGDGDGDDVAAGVAWVGVGLGVDRVVMVLGVGRVDGDERDVPPVLAALERDLAGLLGFASRTEAGKR